MSASSPRRRRLHSEPASVPELFGEYKACVSLYATLSFRSRRTSLFLPRTLRRSRPRPSPAAIRAAPTVRYVAGDESLKWNRSVGRLRCLWCARRFYRFADEYELLLHLRTCHGRFKYELEDSDSQDAKEITIYMTLLEGQEGLLATGVDRFSEPDEENLYINPARYGRKRDTASGVRSKRRSSSSDGGPTPKRQRPLRACSMTTSQSEEKKPVVQRSAQAQLGSRKSKPARAKGNSARVEKGTPGYDSVEQAVKEKRLWHSILQNPVSFEEFQEGVDSDGERDEEHEWRLQIADDEVEEFEDTLPVEKLLMNLWNQFLFMEFNAFADHRLAPACKKFAKKYRRIIQNFNLEVTFLRHLTELGRIGLLDSDAIYTIGLILRNRDENATEEEDGARFLFAERIIKQAEEDEKNGKKRRPNGDVPRTN